MCQYVIKKENDIKYYNNGKWTSKSDAALYNWFNAENIVNELKRNDIRVIIESK